MADQIPVDSQWPAYLVFQQKRADLPHQHAGSVHAPDSEMALMNARDVFVRRPPCISLWVAPAGSVYARTRQELETRAGEDDEEQVSGAGQPEEYFVFQKLKPKESCVFVGTVQAGSPEYAMAQACQAYATPAALWWWVIPARVIAKTEIQDQEVLFEPATRKAFRHQSSFNTLTLMRQITADWQADTEETDES
jgi:ring-1,2-phenylacetyl-CoA epoxidase subunit PaaB